MTKNSLCQLQHQHNFNDVGIHIIYCTNKNNDEVCQFAKDIKTGKIGKFNVVNGQGILDYAVCYQKNKSIGCCHEKSVKCDCSCHNEEKMELEILSTLIFANPCIGCLNPDKIIIKLDISDYQRLCMTHRNVYDEVFD